MRSKIVVGNEEAIDTLLVVLAQDAFDIVGTAAPRFAALYVDDGAERTLERAAAAGVEGGHVADGLAHRIAGQKRRHGVFERRQIVDVIVDRFERARCRIAHDVVHAPFGLAHKQRHAHIERLLQIRRKALEHREHAGDVEAADDYRDAGRSQRFRKVK
jgi:hypothetical protein